jgi:outer membrane protein assembly factor BamE (lipoprotein component of BamABCDE complex)
MRILQAIILSVVLASCAPIIDDRGFKSDDPIASVVKAGSTTQSEVQEKFGSPSTKSNFGEDTWYYITARKQSRAILAPQITEQHVVRITFDTAGVVSKLDEYDLKDGKEVAIVTRETPTEGHKLGFFEQILGNLGRFNKDPGKSVADNKRGKK